MVDGSLITVVCFYFFLFSDRGNLLILEKLNYCLEMILHSKLVVIFILSLSSVVKSKPAKTDEAKRQPRHSGNLSSRQHFELWTESNLNIAFPPLLDYFLINDNPVNINPNFLPTSAGYDPNLITGPRAIEIARYLYSKEPFFGSIPHARILYANQKVRRSNGLAESFISSIRINSPFPTIRYGR